MYQVGSEVNLIIQSLLVVVMIGVFYNIMVSSRVYGGIIGKAIRLFGVGILFLSLSAIEHALINFSILEPSLNTLIMQNGMTLISLVFLGLGFSKLVSATKK